MNKSLEYLTAENAAMQKRIKELEAALKRLDGEFYLCETCDGTGNNLDDPKSACRICGGYGFNPGGDIRDAIVNARALLAKGAKS